MKDESIYSIEMEKRIVDIKNNAAFQAEINGTPATLDLFTRAEANCTISLDWQQKLKKSSKAYTVAGLEGKGTIATVFSTTASTMSSYGEKNSIADLINLKAKYTYSYLLRRIPEDLLADCNYILGLISAHAAGLDDYKITAAYTANLVDLKDKLEEVSKLPKEVIMQHANDLKQYEVHEKAVKKLYDKEMDPFMKIYMLENMELFLAYAAARKVRHHHLKHTPAPVDADTTTGILELLILFKDSMEAAAGVGLVIAALSISETSDVDGEIYIDALAPGTYQGHLSMEGYKDIDFEFIIEAGKTCALQFLMETV